MTTEVAASCHFQVAGPATGRHLAIRRGDMALDGVLFYRIYRERLPGTIPRDAPIQALFDQAELDMMGFGEGFVSLQVYHDGDEPVAVSVVRGEGRVVASGGQRQEEVEQKIVFQGEVAMAVSTTERPILLFATPFFDEQGEEVPLPLFHALGERGEYRHTVPVYGTMVVRIRRFYQPFDFIYNAMDYTLALDEKGQLRHAGGNLTSSLVMARTTRLAVFVQVPRRVTLVDLTAQVQDGYLLRKGPRVELSREGVIDRIFPTPPLIKKPPPPDPWTGRTDYMDVERAVRIHYKQELYDESGRVAEVDYSHENLSSSMPANGYPLQQFRREGRALTARAFTRSELSDMGFAGLVAP